MRARSLRKHLLLLLVVVVVPNVLLKGVLNPNRVLVVEVTKVVVGVGAHKEAVEEAMVAVVELVLVAVVAVVHLSSSSSNMAATLSISKEGEGEGLLSKEEVVEEGMEVVDGALVVLVVAVGEYLLDRPDRKFPSCTKQPQFLIKLGSLSLFHLRRVLRLSHLSLLKWLSILSILA